jgi:GNAT superfamily N-acetyltransferase
MDPTDRVRRATIEDAPGLADVLAAAFFTDPVTRWHVPDERRRRSSMSRFFSAALERIFLPAGATWTTGDSVAAWLPPDQPDPEPAAEEAFLLAIGEIFGTDAWMVEEIMRVHREHHPTERHHYLQFMGTRPDRQGLGIGSAVLKPVLDESDATGTPAYLDASSPTSRGFYARLGFQVVDEYRIPNGPPFWQMRRPAP